MNENDIELEIILMSGFKQADKNNDGFLTREEIRKTLEHTDFQNFADLLVDKADANQDGLIDYQGRISRFFSF